MGEMLTLRAADDHAFGGYSAQAAGARRAGLVVLQEIFGVNAHIRELADGFAVEGYDVVAPALFDRVEKGVELGYGEADTERGRSIRAKVDTSQALMDVQAAVAALRGRDGIFDVGVVGYCWGGSLAWFAATRLFGVSAAVCYYGSRVSETLDKAPRCPVMMHFGAHDHMIAMAEVEKIRAAFPDIPVHVYPAGHGFNCDHRPSYHAESAALARDRTLAFLRDHVG